MISTIHVNRLVDERKAQVIHLKSFIFGKTNIREGSLQASKNENNQRLPEQLMDEQPNPKFTFASVAKRVFVRNYWYENMSPVRSFAGKLSDFRVKRFVQALVLQTANQTWK